VTVPGEGEWVRETLTAPSLLFVGQAVVGQMGRAQAATAGRKPGCSRPTARSQPVGLPACLGCQQADPTEPLQ
jgi:hypothetical protein